VEIHHPGLTSIIRGGSKDCALPIAAAGPA